MNRLCDLEFKKTQLPAVPGGPRMQRRLNTRLLLWSVGLATILAVGINVLHGYQLRRNAHHLRDRAEQALAANAIDQGLLYLGQYLALAPGDVEALATFALTLDKTARDAAEKTRVILRLEDVLTRDPARHDARERLIHNLIALARYQDAMIHLRRLMPHSAKQAELHELLGVCHAAAGDADAAATDLKRAVELEPARIPSYLLLADVLQRRLAQDDEATRVLDLMVEANPKNPQAYLARGRLARQRGHVTAADQDINQAVALAPDDADVLLAAAAWAGSQARPAEARRHLQHGLSVQPAHVALIQALANLELRAGQPAAAIRVLREGAERAPKAWDLQVQLADLLIDAKHIDEAARLIDGMARAELPPNVPNYLQARLAVERRQWTEAIALLEKAAADLGTHSDWSGRVHALLGACYEQVGNAERRLIAWQRAVHVEPGWTVARYGLGLAFLAMDRPEEAAAELDAVSKSKDSPSSVWAALARAQLLVTLRRPQALRDWAPVERALSKATGIEPDNAELTLLRADVLAARGAVAEARTLLEDSRRKKKNVLFWTALANLDARQGRVDDGLKLLDEAAQTFGDHLDVRLARVRLHGMRGNDEDRASLRAVAEGLDEFPQDARVRLWRVLADAWRMLDDAGAAEALWRQIAQAQPSDVRSRFALLESLLQRGAEAAPMRDLVAELRRLEGEEGSHWRWGTAALQVQEARGARDKLAQARAQLVDLGRRQRDWPRIPLLEARIDEIEGKWEGAIDNITKALELGERQPRLVRRLVQLLLERRKFAELEQVLLLCEENGTLPADLARHAAEAAAANRNAARLRPLLVQLFPTAPPLRKGGMGGSPRDYRDLLWLARLHARIDEPAKAEDFLRKAVDSADHAPDPWIALVEHLGRTGRHTSAAAAIAQMQKTMPASRLPYTLAKCWDAAGDPARAAAAYDEALHRQPRDFLLLAAAADFHWRAERADLAAPLYERLLDPATVAPPDVVAGARRQLALCRAAAGHASQALASLDGSRQAFGEQVADQRIRWFLEGQVPAQRRQAIQQLTESFRRHPSRAEEELLLVQLHLAAADPVRAREQLTHLLTADETPLLIAWHARLSLQTGAVQEALLWLAKLERWEPTSPRTQELKQLILNAS